MFISNLRLRHRPDYYDLFIADGKIAQLHPKPKITEANQLSSLLIDYGYSKDCPQIDGQGFLAVPPFIEPHVHLDTTLTAGDPCWNKSGTLFEGIACWSKRKPSLSLDDVKKRARQAIDLQVRHGVQYIRSHVDITDPHLTALKALLEVKQEVRSLVNLELVAFPQEGIYSYPHGKELLEEALKMGADGIGAIPHFEFTREYGVASMTFIFDLMEKYGRFIDVHCDEIDDEHSRFVEVLATNAYERGVGRYVTASHTTAMHSYNNAYVYKLFRLLKLSGIHFIANPLVNIHLQGRFDSYPKRRGITRVKELLAEGINVAFGHDDIFDPWYPLGTGNMLQVLHMGMHVCQMMGYDELNHSLDLITTNSAKLMNLGDYGIAEGQSANFLILPADSDYDALRRQTPPLYSIRRGKVIATNSIPVSQIY